MARIVGHILTVQLHGHRRTCHTTPTGPTVRLSPVDRMTCPADGPIAGSQLSPEPLQDGRGWGGKMREGVTDRIMVAAVVGMLLAFCPCWPSGLAVRAGRPGWPSGLAVRAGRPGWC